MCFHQIVEVTTQDDHFIDRRPPYKTTMVPNIYNFRRHVMFQFCYGLHFDERLGECVGIPGNIDGSSGKFYFLFSKERSLTKLYALQQKYGIGQLESTLKHRSIYV